MALSVGNGNDAVMVGNDGIGTEFHGPVFASLTGASAVANLGVAGGDMVVFDKVAQVNGGTPAATVNVVSADVTLNAQLLLQSATRINL